MQTLYTQEQEMILNFPSELKIKCLKDALKEGKIGVFFSLSKILLDAPINEGGLSSDTINSIFQNSMLTGEII